MTKVKEKIDELVTKVLLEVTEYDLDSVLGGYIGYGCPPYSGR